MGPGNYFYVASTGVGTPVVYGTLTIYANFSPINQISGAWDFHWYPRADTTAQVGPQIGTGNFTGVPTGDSVIIQLNPLNADNNVGLSGLWDGSKLVGTWEWVTITGPRTKGGFLLQRR